MAAKLKALGFQVTVLTDLDQDAMKRAIVRFGQALQAGGVGLFYYAGHGVQYQGRNYLVPIGARIDDEAFIDIETVDVARVLAGMEAAHNRLNIVVLDACRNNPFAGQFRSQSQGLAQLNAPSGTYIAYATGPNAVAEDGAGGNSTFTASLVQRLGTPGAELDDVFKAVRTDVYQGTSGRQTPWTNSSVMGDFYFRLDDTGDTQVEGPEYEVEAEVVAPDPGTITVTVKGGGAVRLDGASKGTVPAYGTLNLKGVAPGRHTASVGSESKAVDVTPGGVVTVELVGEPPAPVVAAPSSGGAVASGRAGIEWVSIPGGSFSMGSNDGDSDEKPVHTVRVAGFEMSRSEVTVGQYKACVDAGACSAPTSCDWGEPNWGKSGMDDHPVNCVTWDDAQTFARWAGGRLPSESEWEYAARGGQSYAYAGSNTAGDVAWYKDNSGGRTHDVCGKRQNSYGLCDMSGNVLEWVEDWYHDSYSGAPTDGSAWTSGGGSFRVIRGGSWNNAATYVRVANRSRTLPGYRYGIIGFRLARD